MNARLSLLLVLILLLAGAAFLWLRPEPAPEPAAPTQSPRSTASDRFFILAVNWQPAFCEGAAGRPECRSQTKSRFDANHFSLHGLWPGGEYCGVSPAIERLDRDSRWSELPAVKLPTDLRDELDEVMPGTRSHLDRHEWTKHGTCFGSDSTAYYKTSTALLAELNASRVRDLFADNIGKRLTQAQIRAAFDASFGRDAGQRVRIACEDDGSRRIISEITIGLWGTEADTLPQLINAARPTSGGCAGGIVDPVGLQ